MYSKKILLSTLVIFLIINKSYTQVVYEHDNSPTTNIHRAEEESEKYISAVADEVNRRNQDERYLGNKRSVLEVTYKVTAGQYNDKHLLDSLFLTAYEKLSVAIAGNYVAIEIVIAHNFFKWKHKTFLTNDLINEFRKAHGQYFTGINRNP